MDVLGSHVLKRAEMVLRIGNAQSCGAMAGDKVRAICPQRLLVCLEVVGS